MFGSVLVGTGRQQYCPAPRIPPDDRPGPCRGLPAGKRVAVAAAAVPARAPAMIVAFVFMVSFLFTVVNEHYGAGRHIEPDLASGFAANHIVPSHGILEIEGNFAGTKVFIILR